MELSGKHHIAATREAVWAALSDAGLLKICIPGCEQLEKVSDTQMRGLARTSIDDLEAAFEGEFFVSQMTPPQNYTLLSKWSSEEAGSVHWEGRVYLLEEEAGTVLSYRAKVQLEGKLAEIEPQIVQKKAKEMADGFFHCLARRLAEERKEELLKEAADSDADNAILHVEEALEVEAGKGTLGGPRVWALIAFAIALALLWILNA